MSSTPSHIAAIISALQFQGGSREGLRSLVDSQWEDIFSRWEVIRLTIPLRQTCGEDLPAWIRSRIDQNLANNAKRFERIKADYCNFANALQGTGIEHLVLKGFTLGPGFVEHPRFRFQSDIDLYCPSESILPARDALAKLGYEPESAVDYQFADHLPSMMSKIAWKWKGNYYDPEIPVSFEFHFCFWNEKILRLHPNGLDQFWSRRVMVTLDNISFPALNPVDNFGYAALNLTRNLLRDQASPHQIYELARFLHTNADNEIFWNKWREMHHDSLRRLEALSCRAALHCFGCRLPEVMEKEMENLPIPVKIWFNKFPNFSLSPKFQISRDWLWMHLSLLESSADRRFVLGKRLFPKRTSTMKHFASSETSSFGLHRWYLHVRKHARGFTYKISRIAYLLQFVPSVFWRSAQFWWSVKICEYSSKI